MLYAASWRAARAMGYKRIVTYISDSENGARTTMHPLIPRSGLIVIPMFPIRIVKKPSRSVPRSGSMTYISDSENGASLRASGWKCVGQAGGLRWTGRRRPEVDLYPMFPIRIVKKPSRSVPRSGSRPFAVPNSWTTSARAVFSSHATSSLTKFGTGGGERGKRSQTCTAGL